MKYILTVIYILFTTGGMALMKLGGDSLKITLNSGPGIKMNWLTFSGFFCYLISFLLWQKMIVKYDLSVMVPIVTGITQIIIVIMGYILFKEKVSIYGIIGAATIVLGIIILSLGRK